MAREVLSKSVFFLLAHRGCSSAQPTSEAELMPSVNCFWDLGCMRDRGCSPEQDKPGHVHMDLPLESGDRHERISAEKNSDKYHKEEKTAKVWSDQGGVGSEGFLRS